MPEKATKLLCTLSTSSETHLCQSGNITVGPNKMCAVLPSSRWPSGPFKFQGREVATRTEISSPLVTGNFTFTQEISLPSLFNSKSALLYKKKSHFYRETLNFNSKPGHRQFPISFIFKVNNGETSGERRVLRRASDEKERGELEAI